MSLESCGASWECRVSVQCERVKEEPGPEHEASVKQEEGWEPVKQEPSEAAAAGLYAGHEVKGELVLGPTALLPPDAAFATTVSGKNAEHTRWPPVERGRSPAGDLPQPHVTTETKQYECEICLKQFSYTSHLLIHKQIHTREEPHELDICPKLVSSKSVTRKRSNHVKKKSFKCDVCGKRFLQNHCLVVHKQIHAKKKPYQCKTCLEQFMYKSSLNRHERFHMKEKLYECDISQKKFSCKSSLEVHVRGHAACPPCALCGARFERRARLLRHARGHIHASLPAERRLHTALSGLRDHSSIYSPSPVDGAEAERTGPPPAEERGRPAEGPRPGARRPDQLRLRACSVRLERLSPAEDKRAHSTILGASVERQTNDGIKPKGPPEAGAASELYSCDACGAQFARKWRLIRHIRLQSPAPHAPHAPAPTESVPNVVPGERCSVPTVMSTTGRNQSVARSRESSHNYSQLSNNYTSATKIPMICIVQHDHCYTGKQLVCDICWKLFANRSSLLYHQRVHTGEKPYKCEFCKKQFSNKSYLASHEYIHTGEKSHKCKFCKKPFSSASSLSRHKRIHSGEKPHKCEICLKQFYYSSGLLEHKRIHTGEKPYKCDICLKQFSLSRGLRHHKRNHTGEKPFKCDICWKKFSIKSTLVAHKRVHTGEKPYKCDICPKRFSMNSTLVAHKRVHTGEKPYKCKICLKQFSQSYYVIHKRIHTGEKPYKCEICLKQFTNSSSLLRHKLIHTGEKPYKCEICLKQFSQSYRLLCHKRIHTGEKPYKCEFCLNCFSSKYSLLSHQCIHGEKPYKHRTISR